MRTLNIYTENESTCIHCGAPTRTGCACGRLTPDQSDRYALNSRPEPLPQFDWQRAYDEAAALSSPPQQCRSQGHSGEPLGLPVWDWDAIAAANR